MTAKIIRERDDYKKTAWELNNDCIRLRTKVERLTAECDAWKAETEKWAKRHLDLSDLFDGAEAERDELRAEVEKLRKALEKIVKGVTCTCQATGVAVVNLAPIAEARAVDDAYADGRAEAFEEAAKVAEELILIEDGPFASSGWLRVRTAPEIAAAIRALAKKG